MADPSTHPAGRGGYNTLAYALSSVDGQNGGGGGGGGADRLGSPLQASGTGAYTLATGALCASGGGGGASWWAAGAQDVGALAAADTPGDLTLSFQRLEGTTWRASGPCGTLQHTVVPAGVTSMDVLAIGGAGGRGGSQASSTSSGAGGGGGGSSWISVGTQRWTRPAPGRPAQVRIDFAVPMT